MFSLKLLSICSISFTSNFISLCSFKILKVKIPVDVSMEFTSPIFVLKILNGIVKLLSAQPQKIPLDLKELLNSQTEVKLNKNLKSWMKIK